MRSYLGLIEKVISFGELRHDRTGVGTRSLFGERLIVDVSRSFPLLTTKQMQWKSVKAELAAFLRGTQDLAVYHELGTHIWDKNVANTSWLSNPYCKNINDTGRIYGVQWRRWKTPVYGRLGAPIGFTEVDQLRSVVDGLKDDPTSRRHVVSAWNPGELNTMCLPPCHLFFQFYVSANTFLDCQMYMRSVDVFLGLPFNIASYALLMSLIAQELGLQARELIMVFGDTHVYTNHFKQCEEQLSRQPYQLPELRLDKSATIDNFHPDMAEVENYIHHDKIIAPMND